jgi:non-specific serine/threonine protein kinase
MGTPAGDADGDALRAHDATRLFLARAERALPGFSVSRSDAAVVARVCRRLDGLPLAIELAASRLKVLSVAEVDERLADRFRLLRRLPAAGVPERQRTLRAAIDWSYGLLDEPERRLLRRLSVFAGGFGLEAAEAVCAGDGLDQDELLDLVAELADRSLVVRGEHGGRARHRLLDSIHDFAAEQCAGDENLERLRSRHFAHFLALAARADEELRGPGQAEWLARMEADEDNLRAAIRWGLSAGDPERALELVWLLHQYWGWRGNFSESRRWFDEAMARADDGPPSVSRARAFTRWGDIALYAGEHGAAWSRYEQAVAIGRAVGDPVRIGSGLNGLGLVAEARGDLVRARPLLEDSLVEFRKAGDRERARWSLDALGRLALAEGDLAAAEKLLVHSTWEARDLGNELGVGESTLYLASVAHAKGDLAAARSLCEESLGLARRLEERTLEGHALTELSRLQLDLGQARAALDAGRAALRLLDEAGMRPSVVAAVEAVAAAQVAAGRPATAARLYGAAAALRERLGAPAMPPESTRHAERRELARAALGEQPFAGEWGRGRALSWEQATALALVDEEPAGTAAPATGPSEAEGRRRWRWRERCGRSSSRTGRCACATAAGCASSPPSWPRLGASSTSWTWRRRRPAARSSRTRARRSTRPRAPPTGAASRSSRPPWTRPGPTATRSARREPARSWTSSSGSWPPPTGCGAPRAGSATRRSAPARR